ncbi:hypothetical protein BDP67DRAFT_39982 [Colletotrichum lupini]|nr:hypothetical protein BDP67DRAFT_39982 [Colletotrichum lupini]
MRLHSICLSLSGISRRLITLTLQRHTPCLVVRGPRQNSATIVRVLCHRHTSHLNDYAGYRQEATSRTARLFIAEEGTKIPPRPSYASPEPRCGHFPATCPYLPHCSAHDAGRPTCKVVWVNLEGEEFVSPRRKATPSHVPFLPHPEKLGLSSRSVLRCPSPKLRPNGDAAGPAKPPQPQVDTPAAYAVTW